MFSLILGILVLFIFSLNHTVNKNYKGVVAEKEKRRRKVVILLSSDIFHTLLNPRKVGEGVGFSPPTIIIVIKKN